MYYEIDEAENGGLPVEEVTEEVDKKSKGNLYQLTGYTVYLSILNNRILHISKLILMNNGILILLL